MTIDVPLVDLKDYVIPSLCLPGPRCQAEPGYVLASGDEACTTSIEVSEESPVSVPSLPTGLLR